jgi:hypothetical protein
MQLEGRLEERNALSFLKWMRTWPAEVFEDAPIEVAHFLNAVEDSVVGR